MSASLSPRIVVLALLSCHLGGSAVFANHPSTMLCGRDPDRQTDHCYAQRIQEPNSSASGFVAIMGQLGALMNPCVPPASTIDFSAVAFWAQGTTVTEVTPWVEFGIVKHDNGANNEPLRYYTFCGNCGDKWQLMDVVPQQDDYFQIAYAGDCWHFFVNAVWKAQRACGVANMKKATKIRIGGETTHWDVDMGPQEFKRLLVQQEVNGIPDVWRHFQPIDTAYIRWQYGNRYFSLFDDASIGSRVMPFDRHFYFGQPSACDPF